jgi:Rieske Fe-S protein
MSKRFLISLAAILTVAFPLILTTSSVKAEAASPCSVAPSAPTLLGPADGAAISHNEVTMSWSAVYCASSYDLTVRKGSSTGKIRLSKNSLESTSFAKSFSSGRSFYWSVAACNDLGCSPSPYQSFKVVKGQRRSSQGPGRHKGSSPLRSIVNYKGPNVYLNTNPNNLYYSDCNWKWVQHSGTIYFAAVGFKPFEQIGVTYLIFNIQGLTDYTTLTADSNGNVRMTWDSTGAPRGHYHWMFTSSSASYCGHFDLT